MKERLLTAALGAMLLVFLAHLGSSALELKDWVATVFVLMYGIAVTGRWWQQMANIGVLVRAEAIGLCALFPGYIAFCPAICDAESIIFVWAGLVVDMVFALVPPPGMRVVSKNFYKEIPTDTEALWAEPDLDGDQEQILADIFGLYPTGGFLAPGDWPDPQMYMQR